MNVYWFKFEWVGMKGFLYFTTLFDSMPYLQIADSGYSGEMVYFTSPYADEKIFAFFPLFPILLGLIGSISPLPIYLTGFLLNIVLGLGVSLLLFFLLPEKHKENGLFLFLYSPITFFLMINYSETLFLLLSLASYYFFVKKKWWQAGVLVGLSMLTRNTGFILFGVYGLYLIHHLTVYRNREAWYSLLKFSGIGGLIGSLFPLYLYIEKGTPFYFIEVQRFYFKTTGFIFDTWFVDIQRIWSDITPTQVKVIILITFILWIVVLFSAVKGMKSYWVLGLFLLIGSLYPLMAKILDPGIDARATRSLMRYMLGLFPVYFLLPLLFEKHPLLWRIFKMSWVILAAIVVISNLYFKFWD